MREKLLVSFRWLSIIGITPAYAGKTAKRSSSLASITSKKGQIYSLLLQAMLSALHPQAPYVAVFQ